MATRPKRVTNYMKNVGKSFGYAVYDVFSEYNPTLKSIGSSTAETTKEIYGAIKEWKDNSRSTEKLGLKGSVGAVFNNLRDDIKTGNWYNKARQDSFDDALMSGMMGGDMSFDFNFDDEDWGDDWGDNSSSSDMDDEWGEDDSAKAMIQANHDQTKKLIGSMDQVGYSVSTSVNKGTITSANYVAEVTKAGHTALLNLNREGFSTIASALATVNQNINAFAKIAEPLTVHMQNSMQFYTNTSEALDKMTKSLDDLVKNTTPVSASKKYGYRQKGTFADIFSADDLFDPSAYIDMVKQNFKGDKELYDMAMNTIKAIDPKKFSPGVFLTRMMVGSMIPAMFKTSMQTLNETVKYAINDTLIKGRQRLTSGSGIGGGILGFLADYILPKDSIKKTIDTSRYEKGKVDWDGKSRKALMEVIPNLLSMIHSDISGSEYLVYDYDQGKFKRASSVSADMASMRRSASNAAAGEFRNDLRRAAAQEFKDTPIELEKVLEEIDAYFEEEFMRSNFDAIGLTSFMKTRHWKELKKRFPHHADEVIAIFNNVLLKYRSSTDPAIFNRANRLTTDMVKGRQRFSNNMYDLEASGDSAIAALESMSEALNGNIRSNAIRNNSISSLYMPDQYGHTLMNYTRGIYKYTEAMYNLIASTATGTNLTKVADRNIKGELKGPEPLSDTIILGVKETTASSRASREGGGLSDKEISELLGEKDKKGAKEQVNSVMYKLKEYFGINGFNAKSIKNLPFIAVGGLLNKISLSISDLIWGKDGMPDSGLFGLFKQKATEAFDTFKDYFKDKFKQDLGDIFEKIFGKKDNNGNRTGGWLSGLWNETKGGLRQAGQYVKNTFAEVYYGSRYQNVRDRQAANEAARNARQQRYEELLKDIDVDRMNQIMNKDYNIFGSGSGLPLYRYRGGASGKNNGVKFTKGKNGQFYIKGRRGAVSKEEMQSIYEQLLESAHTLNDAKIAAKERVENFKESRVARGFGKGLDYFKSVAESLFPKDPTKDAENAKKFMSDKEKEAFKEEVGKGKGIIGAGAIIGSGVSILTGGIIGPLFGGALGAGIGLLISSKTARKAIFGEMDEDGNVKGGIFGPATPAIHQFIYEKLPKVTKGAVLGAIPGMIFGGQFGMFGGMVMGAGLNLLISSDKFNKKMFGDKETGEKGLMDGFKEKIVDKLDELFRNTSNAVVGWMKKTGKWLGDSIKSLWIKHIAKPIKEHLLKRLAGSKIGKALGGAAKKVISPLANIPEALANRRYRKNAKKGYLVYDKNLGRNATAAEILSSNRLKNGDLSQDQANLYRMMASANSVEELEALQAAIENSQNGKRDFTNELNSELATRNRMLFNSGVNAKTQKQVDKMLRSRDMWIDDFSNEDDANLVAMKSKLAKMGLTREQINGIIDSRKKIQGSYGALDKAEEIKDILNLNNVNVTSLKDQINVEKSRFARSDKEWDGVESYQKNIKDKLTSIIHLIHGMATGNMKEINEASKDSITKKTNVSKMKDRINNALTSQDPLNGAQQGHEFHNDIFGTKEMVRDKNGNLVEDKGSSTNKEYTTNKSKFFAAMGFIPSIKDEFRGLGSMFSSLKDKLVGTEKKKGLLDHIKDFLSGEGEGPLSFIGQFISGTKFGKWVKGAMSNVSLGTVMSGIVAPMLLLGGFAEKFDNLFEAIGNIKLFKGNDTKSAFSDNKVSTSTVDPITGEIKEEEIAVGEDNRFSTRLKKNLLTGIIRGHGGIAGAVARNAGKAWGKMLSGTENGKAIVDATRASGLVKGGFAQMARNSTAKNAEKAAKYATKAGALKAAGKDTAKAVAKGQKFAKKAANSSKVAKAMESGLSNGLMQMISNALDNLPAIISKIPFLPSALKDNADEIVVSLYSHIDDVVKKAGSKVGAVAGKIADAMPLINAAYSIGRGINAWGNAESILGITEKATIGQRCIAVLVAVTNSLIPFIGDLIPDKTIVNIFMDILPKLGIDVSDLQAQRDKATEEVSAINEQIRQNGSVEINGKVITEELSIEQYNELNGRAGIFTKAGHAVANGFNKVKNTFKEKGFKNGVKSLAKGAMDAISKTAPGKIAADILGFVKDGDIGGLLSYQPEISEETGGIKAAALKALAFGLKINALPKALGSFLFHKGKDLVGGVIEKVKASVKFIQDEREKGEQIWNDKSVSIKEIFNIPEVDTEDNPLGGVVKAIALQQRIVGAGFAILKNVGSKIGDWIKGVVGKVQAETSQNNQIDLVLNDYMKKGDLYGLWHPNMSEVENTKDNPIGWTNEVHKFYTKLTLTLPTALVANGKWVIDKFNTIKDKALGAIKDGQSVADVIKQYSDKGDFVGMWKAEAKEAATEGNPVGWFGKLSGFITKLNLTVPTLFNMIGNKIKPIWEAFVDPVKKDASIFAQAIEGMRTSAENGDVDSVKGHTFKAQENDKLGWLFNIGHGFMKFLFTAEAFVAKFGGKIKDLWGDLVSGAKEKVTGLADKAIGVIDKARGYEGGSSGFVSQIDPRYAGMNMGGYSFAQKGCGPAVASMITGMPVSDSVSASRRYMTPGGVTADYFTDVLGSRGIRTRATTNPDAMLRSIAGSGNVILLGRDPYNTSKAYSPFGPNPHYVVATGSDGHGNIYVNDPEMNGPTKYPASILRNAQVGIAAGGGAFDNFANLNDNSQKKAVQSTFANLNDKSQKEAMQSTFAKNSSLGGGYTAHGESHYAFKSGGTSSAGTNLRDRGYSSSMDGMNSGGTSYGTASSVNDYRNENLGSWSSLTADQINQFIQGKNGSSPFNGNGNIFVKAANESGLDPRYILAHAAIESGWGTSRISKDKNNYFGIAAFDSSPYASAYSFGSGLEAGIVGGAKWIADHYYHGKYGQTSLYKMRWNDNVHQYATDPNWDQKIAKIMVGMPPNTKFVTNGDILSSSSGTVGGNDVASAVGTDMATGDSATSGNSSSGGAKKKTTIGGILGMVSEAFGKIGQFLSGGLQNGDDESGTSGSSNGTSNGSAVGATWAEGKSPSDWMKSIQGKIDYSMKGPRNPEAGSADCSSTVRWAVQKAGGPDIGGNTGSQYNNSNLIPVWHQGGTYAQTMPAEAQKDDILFFARPGKSSDKGAALDHVGHVGVYLGDGQYIDHGGPGKGTNIKSFKGQNTQLIKVARVAGMTSEGEAVQSGSTPGVYSGNNGYKYGVGVGDKYRTTASGVYSGSNGYKYGVGVGDKYRTSAAGSGLLTYDQLAKVAGGSSGMLMSARPADRLYGRHMRTTFNGPSISPNLLAGGGSGALLDMINSGSSTVPNINVNADPGDAMLNILARILEKVNLLENISTNTAYIQAVKDAVAKLAAGDMAGAQAAAAQAVQSMNDTNEGVDDNFRALVGTLASVAKG